MKVTLTNHKSKANRSLLFGLDRTNTHIKFQQNLKLSAKSILKKR